MIRPEERPLLWTGLLATLSGVGLSRFAYTALMPHMVLADWFTGEQVAYLGAANLLGYLIGALAAAPLASRFGSIRVLGWCWAVVALTFAASTTAQPMALFFVWRLLSGMAGATLMVLGPSTAMSALPPARRAALGPMMFCGIGLGALLSATLVPALAPWSLGAVWTGLAAVAVGTGLWGWQQARRIPLPPPATTDSTRTLGTTKASTRWWSGAVILVVMGYTTDAFGFVPHSVFWVDYLARELQLGSTYAATQWALFGLGAMAGPLCAAVCASRWGWWRTTVGAYAVKAVAIGLPLWWPSVAGHALSGALVGALSPGMAAIISGYLMQLVGAQRHKAMWGYATAAFALLQAIAGYAMASLYVHTGSYRSLFMWGCVALVLGTVLMWCSRIRPAPAGF